MSDSSKVLDTVLTVAIGRNGRSGTPLSDSDWAIFQSNVRLVLGDDEYGGLVVAHVAGADGVGSDGVNEWVTEETAIFVVVNPREELVLRVAISDELELFQQTSACFAVDHFHEPVFSGTTDGFRPRVDTLSELGALVREGEARRTQRH